ncbi:hypothetical protein F5B22DRAFT_647433 [Xylaria bambusicola]|uniref:uncharacterized protein n=1 Tax=Xylaria bambusicola TaxID=326684 RepID=UPI00200870EB|nr:uncharacterized protein F5B22DRAFT_647433 [Xylaria bambusicola]KAI0514676.1 hypothetical protein F5B22DRAFT_647433 [Xylaria bambusicola]
MRASTSALFSFATLASATLSGYPPEGNIVLTVGAGSSLEGYHLVGHYSNGAGFPKFVPAADVAQAQQSEWYLKALARVTVCGRVGDIPLARKETDACHLVEIDGTTYQLNIADGSFTGVYEFTVPLDYYSSDDIWNPTNDSPAFNYYGDSTKFTHACTRDDGDLQLGIYGTDNRPSNCERVQLEYQLVA